MSDHLRLNFNITISNEERTSEYFKLNASYLTDSDNCKGMRELLESSKDELDEINNPQSRWKMIKQKIKMFSMKFYIIKRCQLKIKLNQ